MPDPLLAPQGPYRVELKAGRTYFWCSCGGSKRQPFCDGSHAGSQFTPRKLTAPQDSEAVLCGCKRTGGGPFCDCIRNDRTATRNTAGGEEPLPASAPVTAPDAG
ncbi:MAG: glutamate synthase [Gammaproteobacteria bacterium]|jgi:CDGSH-type Zn-finger protein|nr:glutamate synthase [Gammaproteobacteria bacterium]